MSSTRRNAVADAFLRIAEGDARAYLDRYFGVGTWRGEGYTGAQFERFAKTPENEVTADDLIAVSCLSVHVPARAALAFLGEYAGEIGSLLSAIPADRALEEVPIDEHESLFGPGSPTESLWRLLRADGEQRWGVGPTTASKIMARKRPALIPIYDSVVGKLTGFTRPGGTWWAWHEAFAPNSAQTASDLVPRLQELRGEAGLADISLLRILDVVLWMDGTRGMALAERVDAGQEV